MQLVLPLMVHAHVFLDGWGDSVMKVYVPFGNMDLTVRKIVPVLEATQSVATP